MVRLVKRGPGLEWQDIVNKGENGGGFGNKMGHQVIDKSAREILASCFGVGIRRLRKSISRDHWCTLDRWRYGLTGDELLML